MKVMVKIEKYGEVKGIHAWREKEADIRHIII